METRVLLRPGDEGFQVRVVAETRDYQVHVIGHEAVRSKNVPLFVRSAHELRQDEFDRLRIDEYRAPVIGAEHQGVVDACRATATAFRLKPEATREKKTREKKIGQPSPSG